MSRFKEVLKRSLGVILFAFIPGMAVGAPSVGWFWGGVTGVATVFSSIIIYFGVQLAWDADISHQDIEKGFRAAVAKQSENDPSIKEALQNTLEVVAPEVTAPVAEPVVPQIPVAEQAPAAVAPVVNPDPYAGNTN